MTSYIDWHYIARHVEDYNSRNISDHKNDHLYRIGSHADLLTIEEMQQIDQTGMTQACKNKILAWIDEHQQNIDQAIAERTELRAIAESTELLIEVHHERV